MHAVEHTTFVSMEAFTTRIGGLLPRTEGDAPTYAQIYVHDTDAELADRQAIAPHLRVDTLDSLQQQMHVVSPFVQAFRQMAQVVRESGIQENARLLIRAEGTVVDTLIDERSDIEKLFIWFQAGSMRFNNYKRSQQSFLK